MSREQHYMSTRVRRLEQRIEEQDEEIRALKAQIRWWREQTAAPGVMAIRDANERRTGS